MVKFFIPVYSVLHYFFISGFISRVCLIIKGNREGTSTSEHDYRINILDLQSVQATSL